MIIDTHCHLDFDKYDADRDSVFARARKAGVGRFVNIGSSLAGSKRSVELARTHDDVYATVGIHPHEAASVTDAAMDEIAALAKEPKVVAIGEVGLDYYRNLAPRDVQVAAFRRFLHLARDRALPLVLHAREANREVLDLLKSELGSQISGVMHCFSGDADFMRECLGLGLHISFTANLTYKKADALREVARQVPVERLMVETDAPYLAPQSKRGERNEPAYLGELVDELARLLGLSRADIERITTHNANALFKLGLDESGAKIAYPIRDSLYLNITNRCTNACTFCIRSQTAFVKGHNLHLDREPSVAELLSAIGDAKRYDEIVFCGYGEPTARLDVVEEVAAAVKRQGGRVRLVTNGHGDIINGRQIVPELAGIIDRASVSLNADTEDLYRTFCKPEFGAGTYQRIKDFITACVAKGIAVEVTCLDLPGVDAEKCRAIALSLGATFRPRHVGVVG